MKYYSPLKERILIGWSFYTESEAGTDSIVYIVCATLQGYPGTHFFLFAPLSLMLLFSFKCSKLVHHVILNTSLQRKGDREGIDSFFWRKLKMSFPINLIGQNLVTWSHADEKDAGKYSA